MDPQIIYESKNFIAVNKPAGLLVHKTAVSKQKEKTLVDFILGKYPEVKNVGDDKENRPGIVHRLDKDTSGIIIIARNQKYFEYLKNLFQTKKVRKNYLALVWGKVKLPIGEKGIINKPISLKPGTTKRTVYGGKMTKEAITEYKALKFYKFQKNKEEKSLTLVEVSPLTGRTHQIRVHMAAIGHPVVGDTLYGGKRFLNLSKEYFGLDRQFLHAQSLEFPPESGRKMKLEFELPKSLKNILDGLESNY